MDFIVVDEVDITCASFTHNQQTPWTDFLFFSINLIGHSIDWIDNGPCHI